MPHLNPPVFHPQHPHNQYPRQPYPSTSHSQPQPQPLFQAVHPNVPRYPAHDHSVSDSETSSQSPSPAARQRCFCGREVEKGEGEGEGGIYCSVACARSDAFSSLCYKPSAQMEQPSSSVYDRLPSLASSLRTSTSTTLSSASMDTNGDWTASHYRRLARADLRRDERRDERRRRRAEGSTASTASSARGTIMSTVSSGSSRVPELIGGHSHSRNPSVASSRTSMASTTWSSLGSLSRNASSASSSSRRGGGNPNIHVDSAIMEDADEEEWLASEISAPAPVPVRPRRRGQSVSLSKGKQRQLQDQFGMGKDMRDVLEEIIMMEKGFILSDNEDEDIESASGSVTSAQPAKLFTSVFDRPPRTPSPVTSEKRASYRAPDAPPRGHRTTLSHQHPNPPQARRPPSLVGLHQSSLSESHTALYLATASPIASTTGRRSASPNLQARRSLTFTPTAAGPAFNLNPPAGAFHEHTPQRRRGNVTPSALRPAMDAWRFPSPMGTGSNLATPTKPVPASSELTPLPAQPKPTLL
ncbi:hypothetical protein P7C73_g6687, partial [Tremellales sp. Uapishka_1]